MTSSLLLALTSFVSALLGGLLQAWTSRQTERHRFFRENKREVYGQFLTSLSHLSIYDEDSDAMQSARAMMAESRCKIALYGSPEVVRSVGQVFNFRNFDSAEEKLVLATAVISMRMDTGLESARDQYEALQQLIFGSAYKDDHQEHGRVEPFGC